MREVTWFTWPLPMFWAVVGLFLVFCSLGMGATKAGRAAGYLCIASAVATMIAVLHEACCGP